MDKAALLEMARLRSIVQRLKRLHGQEATQQIIQRVIEMELPKKTAV